VKQQKETAVRTYEVVFVAAPTLTSEELDAFIHHIQSVVEGKNGKLVKVDNWGKKPLAYKIKRFRDAYYVVLLIEGDGAAIAELERRFRVTDYIIRFLSVRIDPDLKRSEKIKAARQQKSPSKQTPGVEAGFDSEPAPPTEF
jgi:small subunit ribosomal protein S6